MQEEKKYGKLITKDGWVKCPTCRSMKLLRLPEDGKIRAWVYCKHCRVEKFLDIDLSLSQ